MNQSKDELSSFPASFTNPETENRRNKRMYEAAAELANLSVWVYDIRQHRIILSETTASEKDSRQYAIPKEIENVPESLKQWIDERDFGKVEALYRAVERGEQHTECTYWYKKIPGVPERCEQISYTTEFDENGSPVLAYGIGMNVTAREQEKQAYRQSVQTMLAADPDALAVFRLNLTENTCRKASTTGDWEERQLAADTADEFFSRIAAEIVAEKEKEEYFRKVSREKLLADFYSGKNSCAVQYRRYAETGNLQWVNVRFSLLRNPDSGDIECITYAQDITKRRRDDAIFDRITNQEFDYVALLHVKTDSIEFLKLNASLSPKYREALGNPETQFKFDAIRRFTASSWIAEEDREFYLQNSPTEVVRKHLDEDGNYEMSIRGHIDGHPEESICRKIQHYYLDDNRDTILIIQSDVTEIYRQQQKEAELIKAEAREATAANRAKSEFLSRMSHDIRTPLNGIIGMTYIARENENPPATVDCLDKIDRSSKFLLGLVNDVLDMSKAESGKITLHPEPYDAEEFFNYLDSVIRPLCMEKNIRFIVDAKPVQDVFPLMDTLRINQVFFNLLSNAVKFTPEHGTVIYRLREKMTESGKIALEAEVADTGIGMSSEFQKVLFEPFTQEMRSDTSEVRGTGLGLSIVKKMLDLMGCEIRVRSEIGKGTTFSLRGEFDCVPAAEVKEKKDRKSAEKATTDLAGRHVLICEDHPLNQEIARTLLQRKKMIVSMAEDGRQGVTLFRNSSVGFYDAVLMDIRMPVMDGYEATKAIRLLDRADAKTVPIIAMTADAFMDDVQKCLKAGMNSHLAKPIHPEELYEILRETMKDSGPF